MSPDSTAAVDSLAIAMLATMGLSLAMVFGLFLNMRRQAARRDAEVDGLLEELAREERAAATRQAEPPPAKDREGTEGGPASGTGPAKPEAWEREADWWRD